MIEPERTIKFQPKDPQPAVKTPSGYAAVPRQVTRRPDLRPGAKVVINALLGLCWGDERQTSAPIRTICAAAGMPRRSVQRHLTELTRAGLITRRPDLNDPGGNYVTYLLCHPKEFQLSNDPRENWRCTSAMTPRQNGATPRQNGATPRQNGAGHLLQPSLNLCANSPPNPPTGGTEEGTPPTHPGPEPGPRPRRKTRMEEILDSYREWANEPPQT